MPVFPPFSLSFYTQSHTQSHPFHNFPASVTEARSKTIPASVGYFAFKFTSHGINVRGKKYSLCCTPPQTRTKKHNYFPVGFSFLFYIFDRHPSTAGSKYKSAAQHSRFIHLVDIVIWCNLTRQTAADWHMGWQLSQFPLLMYMTVCQTLGQDAPGWQQVSFRHEICRFKFMWTYRIGQH